MDDFVHHVSTELARVHACVIDWVLTSFSVVYDCTHAVPHSVCVSSDEESRATSRIVEG